MNQLLGPLLRDPIIHLKDTSINQSLRIYEKGIIKNKSVNESIDGFGNFKMKIKYGNEILPYIKPQEPLQIELEHFIDCINKHKQPLTNGNFSLKVLGVLEAAQISLNAGGKIVKIKTQ